jgi:hypothetical protein
MLQPVDQPAATSSKLWNQQATATIRAAVVRSHAMRYTPKHKTKWKPGARHQGFKDDTSWSTAASTASRGDQRGVHCVPHATKTFVMQHGAFQFLVMPFSQSNALAVFTLIMNDALRDLPYALVFMDDILVFSATIPEHYRHLHKVLQRLAPGKSMQPLASASFTALPPGT